jgi:hypothetical protein
MVVLQAFDDFHFGLKPFESLPRFITEDNTASYAFQGVLFIADKARDSVYLTEPSTAKLAFDLERQWIAFAKVSMSSILALLYLY